MKTSQKSEPSLSLSVAAGATVTHEFDMTNFKGLALQLTKATAATASAKMQWSMDKTTWEDVPAGNGGATKVVDGGDKNYFWNLSEIYMGTVRLSIDTVAGATMTYSYKMLAKAH